MVSSSTAVAERPNAVATRQISFQDVVNNLDVYVRIAQHLSKSEKTGGMRSVDSVIATLIQGAELGFPPMTAINCIHPIGNRLTLAASAAQALVIRDLGGKFQIKESFDWEHLKDAYCEVTLTINGREPYTARYSMVDAEKAGLLKKDGNWDKNPKDMLFSKAMLRACRRVAPDALHGLYSPEELDGVIDVEPGQSRNYKTEVQQESADVIGVDASHKDDPVAITETPEPNEEIQPESVKDDKPKSSRRQSKAKDNPEPEPQPEPTKETASPTPVASDDPPANDAALVALRQLKEDNEIGSTEWMSLVRSFSPDYKSARDLKQSEALKLANILRKRLAEGEPEKN